MQEILDESDPSKISQASLIEILAHQSAPQEDKKEKNSGKKVPEQSYILAFAYINQQLRDFNMNEDAFHNYDRYGEDTISFEDYFECLSEIKIDKSMGLLIRKRVNLGSDGVGCKC